jgi:hypothetical protein
MALETTQMLLRHAASQSRDRCNEDREVSSRKDANSVLDRLGGCPESPAGVIVKLPVGFDPPNCGGRIEEWTHQVRREAAFERFPKRISLRSP